MKNLGAALLAAAFCTFASAIAGAQDFPRRAITVVLPYAAGGVTDQMTRLVAAKVAENVGQPVVVENRPGGGGQVAAGYVKQSPPDGYTLLIGDIGTHAINASLYSKLSYDPVKDFAPVIELVELPHVLVAPRRGADRHHGGSRRVCAQEPRSADLRLGRRRQRRSPARRTTEVRIQASTSSTRRIADRRRSFPT